MNIIIYSIHIKIKKMIKNQELINNNDILYKDDLVCILKPHIKKGIIIWSDFKEVEGSTIAKTGLKTGKQLNKEGIDFGRNVYHPYIFFRAPYYSKTIDYSTIDAEVNSLYGEGQITKKSRAFIRVDPNRTYVFSSEIRAKKKMVYFNKDGKLLNDKELSKTHSDYLMKKSDKNYKNLYEKFYNNEINKSKKLLKEYLDIIKYNENLEYKSYNLYSSKKVNILNPVYPFDNSPIERNSEILVSIPNLTPKYFVLCN